MHVRETLRTALELLARDGAAPEAIDEARVWLARTEIFLDWVAKHPRLVEVNCEAAYLVTRYRGNPDA
jgi:hypothetical protein